MENKIIPTIGVLLIKDERVLLVKHLEGAEHLSGKYGLPGGRIEEGEEDIYTAQRELIEETGLMADSKDLIRLPKVWRAIIERKDGKKEFSLEVFLTGLYNGELMGSTETTPEWVNIEDLNNYDLLPNVKDIISYGLKFWLEIKS